VFTFPQILIFEVPMRWKNQDIYLVKFKLLPIFYIWDLTKRIYFSTLDVDKKVSLFLGVNCKSLSDQLSSGKHKQNILMSVFSCIYIRVENWICIVLCSDRFVLKLMPCWDLVFKTLISTKSFTAIIPDCKRNTS